MGSDRKQLTFLDGGMGTQLLAGGMQLSDNLELAAITHPALVESVHRAYIEAGSNIVYANTFGVNGRKLRGSGHTVLEAVMASVECARRACRGHEDVLIALDIGPLGELLEPMGTLSFEDAYALFAEIAAAGRKAGADLAVIETMTDLQEARAALLAVKEHTDLPVYVTMTFDETGRTFTGCTVASMARTLTGLGADAIGVNCSLGPNQLAPVVQELCRCTHLPVIAKPNAGLPDPVDGHYDMTAADFAAAMRPLIEAGASIVGGCCGTDPTYIAALTAAAADLAPGERVYDDRSFVCTPTIPLYLDGVRPIGERINPTGKKRFQQALLSGDVDYIVDVGLQEQDAGAALLDVNVGYPGVDEVTMLPRVVKALQSAVDLPLMLDSSNPDALEAGLRVYCGKAAVNSVNGSSESMAKVLPLVKKYGAAVVGLALDEGGLPQTAQARFDIAQRILNSALALGIPRQDVWIDCLTLTVSAQQDQAEETLRAVRMVTEQLGLRTVLGVSNISFGLPNRVLMTTVFLIRAMTCGLSLPIINPNQQEIMDAISAFRVLSGEDAQSSDYVARFAQAPAAVKPAAQPGASLTIDEAITRGLRTEAARLAKELLTNEDELTIVEQHLIPALDKVGVDYEKGLVFLPQLLSAAQAAQSVFEVLRERMALKGDTVQSKGTIIIATVKGDIHDIGKNIVKTVLENYGYEVIDLGRDVPPERIVAETVARRCRLVGLSALMTTTLPAMEETAAALLALPDAPVVMVGGAVVTEDYAARMGAVYTHDARAAVAAARSVFGA